MFGWYYYEVVAFDFTPNHSFSHSPPASSLSFSSWQSGTTWTSGRGHGWRGGASRRSRAVSDYRGFISDVYVCIYTHINPNVTHPPNHPHTDLYRWFGVLAVAVEISGVFLLNPHRFFRFSHHRAPSVLVYFIAPGAFARYALFLSCLSLWGRTRVDSLAILHPPTPPHQHPQIPHPKHRRPHRPRGAWDARVTT